MLGIEFVGCVCIAYMNSFVIVAAAALSQNRVFVVGLWCSSHWQCYIYTRCNHTYINPRTHIHIYTEYTTRYDDNNKTSESMGMHRVHCLVSACLCVCVVGWLCACMLLSPYIPACVCVMCVHAQHRRHTRICLVVCVYLMLSERSTVLNLDRPLCACMCACAVVCLCACMFHSAFCQTQPVNCS